MRAAPDISMDGGNSSPVYVYISDQGGWYAVYGTSLAVQLAGASVGLANGMRAIAGNPTLSGTLGYLYTDAAGIPSGAPYTSNFRDITSGTAGSFTAGPGWDYITGLGSLKVSYLVPNTLATQGLTADFSISAKPSSQTVMQGNATSYTVTVTALNSFGGVVGFSASNLPTGVTANFNPASVSGSGSSTVTVTTGSTTPAGTYANLTFTGTGPSTSHSATATLVVNPAVKPDFSISASPSSLSVSQGSSQKSTITLTSVNGFINTVNLSVLSSCPANAACTFSANPVKPTGSSLLTVAPTTSTPAGVYTVTVQGNDTISNTTHSTTVKVTVVADFTLSVSGLTVTRGSSNSETVGAGEVRSGDSTSVNLSISGLPNQTSATFTPNPVASGGSGSTLTIRATNRAKAGNYTVTVSGSNGTSTHTAPFTLAIK
jgi:hypothetical protein